MQKKMIAAAMTAVVLAIPAVAFADAAPEQTPSPIGRMIIQLLLASEQLKRMTYTVAYAAEIEPLTARQEIEALIIKYARIYAVPAETMHAIVACETGGTFDPEIRSEAIYRFNDPKHGIVKGTREKSYGLAQIHIPMHDVTIAQAKDPDFALDFMAKNLAAGHRSWWTC